MVNVKGKIRHKRNKSMLGRGRVHSFKQGGKGSHDKSGKGLKEVMNVS